MIAAFSTETGGSIHNGGNLRRVGTQRITEPNRAVTWIAVVP